MLRRRVHPYRDAVASELQNFQLTRSSRRHPDTGSSRGADRQTDLSLTPSSGGPALPPAPRAGAGTCSCDVPGSSFRKPHRGGGWQGSGTPTQEPALDRSPDPLPAALEKHPDKSEPKRGKCSASKDYKRGLVLIYPLTDLCDEVLTWVKGKNISWPAGIRAASCTSPVKSNPRTPFAKKNTPASAIFTVIPA